MPSVAAPFSEHPDQHRPDDPILLDIDQQLRERAGLVRCV